MVPDAEGVTLRRVATVRVLYADTDKMGFVYHGTYLRYLEHGRVELIRAAGMAYADLEVRGFGLPVTEVALNYSRPGRYDALVAIEVGVALLRPARVHFQYRLASLPGEGHSEGGAEVLLRAQTRHCCVRLSDGRPTRIPTDVYELLGTCYT